MRFSELRAFPLPLPLPRAAHCEEQTVGEERQVRPTETRVPYQGTRGRTHGGPTVRLPVSSHRVTDLGLGGRLLHVTPRDRATSTCVFAFVCVSCARAVPLAGHGGLGRVSVVCTPSGSRHGAAPRRLVSCGCRNAVAPRVPTCWIPTRAASPSLWLLASYAHGTAR